MHQLMSEKALAGGAAGAVLAAPEENVSPGGERAAFSEPFSRSASASLCTPTR